MACSLSARDLGDRRARWRAVADRALLDARRTPTGARQRYRADAGVETELRALIALEAECCAFLRFDLRDDVPRELVLAVDGPAAAAPLLGLFAGEAT